jgi:alpha-ribazole phosphatase/probable phosphoglycerate mutase
LVAGAVVTDRPRTGGAAAPAAPGRGHQRGLRLRPGPRCRDRAHRFAGSSTPIRLDQRLRDCNYGLLNGAPVDQITAQKPDRIDDPFPGGQSYRHVVDQTRDLLAELATAWDGHRVLLLAHSATRYALDHLLPRQPLHDLVTAPCRWQEGWLYHLPTTWTGT